jgi:hypothetical protein
MAFLENHPLVGELLLVVFRLALVLATGRTVSAHNLAQKNYRVLQWHEFLSYPYPLIQMRALHRWGRERAMRFNSPIYNRHAVRFPVWLT